MANVDQDNQPVMSTQRPVRSLGKSIAHRLILMGGGWLILVGAGVEFASFWHGMTAWAGLMLVAAGIEEQGSGR